MVPDVYHTIKVCSFTEGKSVRKTKRKLVMKVECKRVDDLCLSSISISCV